MAREAVKARQGYSLPRVNKAGTKVVAFLARTDLCMLLGLSVQKLFFPLLLSMLEYNDTCAVPPREALLCESSHSA